jgi:hypothetical protein
VAATGTSTISQGGDFSPPTGKKCHGFISHAGLQQRDFVDFLLKEFNVNYPAVEVFVDERSLPKGGEAMPAINAALADAFVGEWISCVLCAVASGTHDDCPVLEVHSSVLHSVLTSHLWQDGLTADGRAEAAVGQRPKRAAACHIHSSGPGAHLVSEASTVMLTSSACGDVTMMRPGMCSLDDPVCCGIRAGQCTCILAIGCVSVGLHLGSMVTALACLLA